MGVVLDFKFPVSNFKFLSGGDNRRRRSKSGNFHFWHVRMPRASVQDAACIRSSPAKAETNINRVERGR